MKKFLLILFMGVVSSHTVMAQLITSSQMITTEKVEKQPLKYEQSVELSFYTFEGDKIGVTIIGVDYIGGVRFSNLFYLGAGIGINYNTYSGNLNLSSEGGNHYYYNDKYLAENPICIPLYLHTRFYFTRTRCQPFIALSLGGQFTTYKKDEYYDWGYNPSCLFINPLAGVNYRLNDKVALYLDLGYTCRYVAEYMHFSVISRDFQYGLEMNIGCTF